MKYLITTLLLLGLPISTLAGSKKVNMVLESATVRDSILHVKARIDPRILSVRIDANFLGTQERHPDERDGSSFVGLDLKSPGVIDAEIQLPSVGVYQIQVQGWTDWDKDPTDYVALPFKVENSDGRPERLYLLLEDSVRNDRKEIQALVDGLVAGEKSQLGKVLKIRKWIAENIAYDFKWADLTKINPTNVLGNQGDIYLLKYKPLDVLVSKKTVCIGYSRLFAAMTRLAGVPSKVILGLIVPREDGSTAGHAWNEVYLNGRWVFSDLTFDYTLEYRVESGVKKFRDYEPNFFDRSPDLLAKTHARRDKEESALSIDTTSAAP